MFNDDQCCHVSLVTGLLVFTFLTMSSTCPISVHDYKKQRVYREMGDEGKWSYLYNYSTRQFHMQHNVQLHTHPHTS